jgi:chorismate mutase
LEQLWVRGIRGAVTVAENTYQEIISATEQLLTLIMKENGLDSERIISIIFSMTADLDAVFPAEAARRMGWSMVPLLCTKEIPVTGSMKRCIRVLMHAYMSCTQTEVRHVYLGEAAGLRPDLHPSQGSVPHAT